MTWHNRKTPANIVTKFIQDIEDSIDFTSTKVLPQRADALTKMLNSVGNAGRKRKLESDSISVDIDRMDDDTVKKLLEIIKYDIDTTMSFLQKKKRYNMKQVNFYCIDEPPAVKIIFDSKHEMICILKGYKQFLFYEFVIYNVIKNIFRRNSNITIATFKKFPNSIYDRIFDYITRYDHNLVSYKQSNKRL